MLRGISAGDSAMMGRQKGDQSQFIYMFNLEGRVPARHLLRRINAMVTCVLADLIDIIAPSRAIS